MSNNRNGVRTAAEYAPNLLDWHCNHFFDWSNSSLFAEYIAEATTTNRDNNADDNESSDGWSRGSSHSSVLSDENEYEDEDDYVAFRRTKHYVEEILPLKRKRKRKCRIFLDGMFNMKAADRLGGFLSRSNHLRSLSIHIDCLSKDNVYKNTIPCLFRGPFERHPLKTFSLTGDHIGEAWAIDMREASFTKTSVSINCITEYLQSSASLQHLKFTNLRFDEEAFDLLSTALKKVKLKKLMFDGFVAQESSFSKFLRSVDTGDLETLHLINCAASVHLCETLANLLKKEDCVLGELSLNNHKQDPDDLWPEPVEVRHPNRIDDRCIEVLCGALKNNTVLTHLELSQNHRITKNGWRCFEDLLFDTSSLNSIALSNLTLTHIGRKQSTMPLPEEFVDKGLLATMLRINGLEHFWDESSSEFALRRRLKITKYLTMGDVFNATAFDDIDDAKLMPYVLAFLGEKRPGEGSGYDGAYFANNSAIYAVLKTWDMPTLFAFPSREKVLWMAEVNRLKEEVDTLHQRNEKLASEIRQLKGGSLTEESSRVKKRAKLNDC